MRTCTVFALICGFVFLGAACTSNPDRSFREIAGNDSYAKSVFVTNKYFDIDMDLENIEDLCDTTVFDDDAGKIILKTAKFVSSDTIHLQFEAHGVTDGDRPTVLTACAYDEKFLQSQISVTPSEDTIIRYSLKTTEFENFGNRFSVSVLLPDPNLIPLKSVKLTFSELLLVSFLKET